MDREETLSALGAQGMASALGARRTPSALGAQGVPSDRKILACLQAAAGLLVFSVCLTVGDAVIGSAHQANPMLAWLLMNLAGDPSFWTSDELRAVMARDALAGWMVLWPQMRLSLSALSGLLAAWVLRPALSEASRLHPLPAAGA